MFFTAPLSNIAPQALPYAKSELTRMLKACTFGELTKYRVAEMYKQVSARIQLLNEINSHILDTYAATQTYQPTYGPLGTVTWSWVDVATSKNDVIESLELQIAVAEELEYVEGVLSQLDITNTIDQIPPCSSEWRKYITERPAKLLREQYGIIKPKGIQDEASRILLEGTLKLRRNVTVQRLLNAMRIAHDSGWYFVFDTLTLSDDRIFDFYEHPTALRDYFRSVGRLVLAAEGRPVSGSAADCYQYFCVPEYGSKEGRLHFHVVHLLRTLPRHTLDPNAGRAQRTRRQLNTLMGLWSYGFNQPIGVRYSQDAFGRLGWLWPVDKNKKPLQPKDYRAVAFYVAKYVSKKTDFDIQAKGLGASKWNNLVQAAVKTINPKLFRVRMSRNFGTQLPSMRHLSTDSLIEMTLLRFDSTPMPLLLKQSAKRELKFRMRGLCMSDVLEHKPETTNLLQLLRRLMQDAQQFNPQNAIAIMTPKLADTDISDETKRYLDESGLRPTKQNSHFRGGSK